MVFVLDSHKQPLAPYHEARARELLRKGKAAVFRRYPFTIILCASALMGLFLATGSRSTLVARPPDWPFSGCAGTGWGGLRS
jgi:hypothetical protein